MYDFVLIVEPVGLVAVAPSKGGQDMPRDLPSWTEQIGPGVRLRIEDCPVPPRIAELLKELEERERARKPHERKVE